MYKAMRLADARNKARRAEEELPLLRKEMAQWMCYFAQKHALVLEQIAEVQSCIESCATTESVEALQVRG